jgi:hypothetical protein
MLPERISTLLDRLRRRERLLALSWSVARWLSAAAAALVAFALVDYTIDLSTDTPGWLRATMGITLFGLCFAAYVAVVILSEWPIRREQVALWVEERCPAFHHRLISAVQFHRKAAKTEGMSPDLIDATTRQAAQLAHEVEPSQVLDGGRFRRAALLAGPVFGALLVLVLFNPALASVLFRRLMYSDNIPIPRSVELVAHDPAVWPAGEEGTLRIVVYGRLPAPETTGELRVERGDGTVSRHPLAVAERDPDDPRMAFYAARVPAGDAFTYTARLADGRTRLPGLVRYVPRPVVQALEARVQLPASVGLRPAKRRYEEPQKGGDIVHRLPGSLARVRVSVQKEITKAVAHVAGASPRAVELNCSPDALSAEGTFPLQSGDTAYEIEVRDKHNFANADRPRRTISTASLERPEVTLLPENFAPKGYTGPKEDYEAEGVPVAVEAPFKIEYTCAHRYGLSHAQLRYRVIRRGAAKEESGPIDTAKFLTLPLGPSRGQAAKPTARALRELSTRPRAGGDAIPDTEGGGTCDFELTGIPDGQGGRLKINEGDRIQFFVEVFSKADPDGTPGRSVIREKEVVSEKGYSDWFIQKINLTERTRELEERQRGAAPPGSSP